MRMVPSRLFNPQPTRIKGGPPAKVKHLSAPLKGLSMTAKLTGSDPLLSPILDNFVVTEDRVQLRPGLLKITTTPPVIGGSPATCLIPHYRGGLGADYMCVSAGSSLFDYVSGAQLKTGFTSDDWHWTSFSNLGVADYTIMVNGANGVWSWNGTIGPTGFVKETVTAPAAETWIQIDEIEIVLSHMNRLWFADGANLALYYLPIQQKTGEVKLFPLNSIFKRGGHIRALATWSLDGGRGMDDQLAIFTTNGEVAIYSGTDPDTDFSLVGVFRIDAPMSKHCVLNYGGELYVLISTGVVPMSTTIREESEQLGKTEKGVVPYFTEVSNVYRNSKGWQAVLNHGYGAIIANMPLGAPNQFKQMVRTMPHARWTSWSKIPARFWTWLNNRMYCLDEAGIVYENGFDYLNDNGNPIKVDIQWAWSDYGTPAYKHYKMIKIYIVTDGQPRPMMDMRVDYDYTEPTNQPDVSFTTPGAIWDTAPWDTSDWAKGEVTLASWQGVAKAGHVGGPRLTCLLMNCSFAITGATVLYEQGSVMG